MNALQTSLFLLAHLFIVNTDTTEVGHAVCFEGRAFTVTDYTSFRVIFLCLFKLIALIEAEGCFSLLGDLNTLLLNSHPTLLIFILDLLITRNENGSWDWLAAELVLNHVINFNLLFHDHFVDLALTSARLFGHIVSHLKREWLWYSYTVPALAVRFISNLMHVVISCDTLLTEIAIAQVTSTLVSTESSIIVLSLQVLAIFIRVKLIVIIESLEDPIIISLAHVSILRVFKLEGGPFLGFLCIISIVVVVPLLKPGHASTLSLFFTTPQLL